MTDPTCLLIFEELSEMIQEYFLMGFPPTPTEIRNIACAYVAENGLAGFSEDKKSTGYKWFYVFMKYHNKLCIKNGVTNLSLARALGPHKG